MAVAFKTEIFMRIISIYNTEPSGCGGDGGEMKMLIFLCTSFCCTQSDGIIVLLGLGRF